MYIISTWVRILHEVTFSDINAFICVSQRYIFWFDLMNIIINAYYNIDNSVTFKKLFINVLFFFAPALQIFANHEKFFRFNNCMLRRHSLNVNSCRLINHVQMSEAKIRRTIVNEFCSGIRAKSPPVSVWLSKLIFCFFLFSFRICQLLQIASSVILFFFLAKYSHAIRFLWFCFFRNNQVFFI